jgi:hypothetical protein
MGSATGHRLLTIFRSGCEPPGSVIPQPILILDSLIAIVKTLGRAIQLIADEFTTCAFSRDIADERTEQIPKKSADSPDHFWLSFGLVID